MAGPQREDCSVTGCTDRHSAKGFCRSHYFEARKRPCPSCDVTMIQPTSARCYPCSAAARRGVPFKSGRHVNQLGYVELSGQYDHPNAGKRGRLLEHIKVMSDILGRPLLPGENVHHKNGVRDDNRAENLELWVVKQPQGQRPEDLLAWAYEIIARYGTESAA